MAKSLLPESPLPTAWSEVLDNVLEALERTAGEAARRAQTLEPPSSPDEAASACLQALQEGPSRLEPFQALVRRADRTVAEADAVLAAEEDGARAWLAQATAVARRLADGAGGAV